MLCTSAVADHKLATGQLDSLSGTLYVWLELNGLQLSPVSRELLRYDARCYFNVRSKADISQLNLPHGTDN